MAGISERFWSLWAPFVRRANDDAANERAEARAAHRFFQGISSAQVELEVLDPPATLRPQARFLGRGLERALAGAQLYNEALYTDSRSTQSRAILLLNTSRRLVLRFDRLQEREPVYEVCDPYPR